MIALRLHPPGAAEGSAPRWARTLKLGGRTIRAGARPPFGFVLEHYRLLAVGEAVGAVDETALLAFVASPTEMSLPEGLLGLVAVDEAQGRIVAAASLRAARSYLVAGTPDGAVAFATGYRLLAELGVTLEAAEEHYGEVLVYRFLHAPNTLCRGVEKLAGGETRVFDLKTGRVLSTRREPFPVPATSSAPAGSSEDEARLAAIDAALDDEIRRGVEGTAHPRLLLSGGLDSTLVGAIARERTTTLPSDSSGFSFLHAQDGEEAYAASAARSLGLPHEAHGATPERYLSGLVHAVARAEEPLHHLQSVMLSLLFEDVGREACDVMLCGEAADGLFGTETHQQLHLDRTLVALSRATSGHGAFRLLRRLSGIRRERLDFMTQAFGRTLKDETHVLHSLGAYGNLGIVHREFGYDAEAVTGPRRRFLEPTMDLPLLQQVTVVGLLCQAAATMPIWGKLAEAQGIGLLLPFAAPAVLRAASAVPWKDRLREPKHTVRQLLRRHGVEETLITRPKLSFGLPYRFWSTPGALFQPLVDMAGSMWDPKLLQSLQTEVWDEAMILWNALQLFVWRRLMIDGVEPDDFAAELLDRHRA